MDSNIEFQMLESVKTALKAKTNGKDLTVEEPSVLTNVSRVSKLAGEAISKSGEELAKFIEDAGEEVNKLAHQYSTESKELAAKLREMYQDETSRLNHFMDKIQELRDAMAEAQTKFLGAGQ
jgi:DNA-directed RNA polymerase subunit F